MKKKSSPGIKAIFLDRDGTIIEDRGHLSSPSQVVFFDDTFPALRRVAGDYQLFMITNQQGISQGIVNRKQVDRVNRHVERTLEEEGISISDIYICPHTKDDACQCRKPSPFFLYKAARDYGLDLSSSFVIGDHPGDVLCATNAGAQGIYVLTGHGQKHRPELPADALILPGISDAIDFILGAS
jgi:D-glycero-D-manno-heptose 1,7-bisphosphate phosphatase